MKLISRFREALENSRRPHLVGLGPALIAMAPLARFIPWIPAVVPWFNAALGIAWILWRICTSVAKSTTFDSFSMEKNVWRERLESSAKLEAFKYYQTKYFHQDRLMWSRLQLFFAIQVATLSVGAIHKTQATACVALAVGIVLALRVLELFIEDDKIRRAARVAMEAAADLAELNVPIVGGGGGHHHPTITIRVMWLIVAADVVLYIVRLKYTTAPLG